MELMEVTTAGGGDRVDTSPRYPALARGKVPASLSAVEGLQCDPMPRWRDNWLEEQDREVWWCQREGAWAAREDLLFWGHQAGTGCDCVGKQKWLVQIFVESWGGSRPVRRDGLKGNCCKKTILLSSGVQRDGRVSSSPAFSILDPRISAWRVTSGNC